MAWPAAVTTDSNAVQEVRREESSPSEEQKLFMKDRFIDFRARLQQHSLRTVTARDFSFLTFTEEAGYDDVLPAALVKGRHNEAPNEALSPSN